MLGASAEFRIEVNANETAPHAAGCHARRSRAGERIEHDACQLLLQLHQAQIHPGQPGHPILQVSPFLIAQDIHAGAPRLYLAPYSASSS
jgi:hypothetical protein